MSTSVRDLQSALAGLGLYTGTVDDVWGDLTEQAVKSFQRANGLPDNGRVSTRLLDMLFLPTRPDREDSKAGKGAVRRWPHDDTQSLLDFYGEPGEDLVMLELPYEFRLAWDLNTAVSRARVHRKCHDAWGEVFSQTLAHYGMEEIKRLRLHYFGGGIQHRAIRGGKRLSTHNWCAMDFDPARNGLKTPWDKAAFSHPDYQPFWNIVYGQGGVSLGKEFDYDAMHIQFAWR